MRAVASLKISTLMCYFCRKYIMFEPKKCTVAMCHNITKFEEEMTYTLENDMRNLVNF